MNAEPRWLDDREAQVWRAFIELSHGMLSAMDRQLTRDSHLSAAEYAVLVPLSESATGIIRARELVRALGWERSRLSHLLKRMETRGYLRRMICDTDARGSNIAITQAGRDAIRRAAPGHVAFARSNFFDALSAAEQDALLETSNKIRAALRTHGLWDEHGRVDAA